MGKKKSGRIGGIRLEAKSSSSDTSLLVNNAPGPSAQKTVSHTGLIKESVSLESIAIEVDFESPLEKLLNKANDEASFQTFVDNWNNDIVEKQKLREANRAPAYDVFEKLISSKQLDSNLKKCTGCVRKIRQYTDFQRNSVENDIKTLNLTKYLTEIAAAITEARFKIENVQDIVTICSWIHQRYVDFAPMLTENYKKTSPTKKTEMNSGVLSKLSVDLRVIGDLVVCGVMPIPEGCTMLYQIIRNLILMDREGMQCLVPVMSFCLGLGDAFMGIIPRKASDLCQDYNVTLLHNQVLVPEKQAIFKDLMADYFSVVCKTLLKSHQETQKSELYNRKLLKTRGEISADRKEAHLVLQNKFEKYNHTARKFAGAINQDLPQMYSLPADPEEEEEKALLRTDSGEYLETVPGIVIFDDEETRSFYQDFKDLKVYLPPVAYRESIQQTAEETQAIEEREKALDDFDVETEAAELEQEEGGADGDDANLEMEADTDADVLPSMRTENDEDKEADKPIKPNFQEFLNNLPNCVSRSMIDKAAFEFAESHNNKLNRRKLVNTLFRVPRQRMDLLAFYARFVAILNPVMPDVGLDLCQFLRNDFRFLVRRKNQLFIETKVKIVRFISELVNFRIYPKSDALACLKILLMHFVHHQIEMACVFVETCGRMLYRTPESHRKMKIYLEEMMRKKTVKSLEPRYVSMIDHAYYMVLPREEAPRMTRKLTPIELYLEAILVGNLTRDSLEHARDIVKGLQWDDDWVNQVACNYLACPWKITYSQLPLHAQILSSLIKVEPDVVTRVIDIVVEEIRRGLEHPFIDFNHRRYSTLQYLSELYYHRLLKSENILDVLYLLITYGVSWDNKFSSTDPPDNLYRIRLSCFLLKECGEFFNHGSSKKKLRLYLLHLQKYIWLKRSHSHWSTRIFPFGVYELWEDTVRKLHPKMVLATDFEEAQSALSDAEADTDDEMETVEVKHPKFTPVSETAKYFPMPNEFYGETFGSRDHMTRTGVSGYPGGNRLATHVTQNGMWYPDGQAQENISPDPFDEEALVMDAFEIGGNKQQLSAEDEEFINLFEKMCSEVNYGAVRDGGKHMKTDIAIPLHISNSSHSTSFHPGISGDKSSPDSVSNTVPFVLITRKGNKQQYKTLPVPADSDFVRRIKNREETEREEKESVKKRTLAISQMQEAEEREREHEAIKAAFTAPRDYVVNRHHKARGDVPSTSDPGTDSNKDSSSDGDLPPSLSMSNRQNFEKWVPQYKRGQGLISKDSWGKN